MSLLLLSQEPLRWPPSLPRYKNTSGPSKSGKEVASLQVGKHLHQGCALVRTTEGFLSFAQAGLQLCPLRTKCLAREPVTSNQQVKLIPPQLKAQPHATQPTASPIPVLDALYVISAVGQKHTYLQAASFSNTSSDLFNCTHF